ncbi:MAG: mechanosensitive ion channel [Xanthomonadales bacterium]|nr:mechanosensitive ion channel [Xanthomonadales bacterium]
MFDELSGLFSRFLPLLLTVSGVVGFLVVVNWSLRRRWRENPDAQFRFQVIMLLLTFAGGLAIIIAMPINDALRGQLLGLIGILLSAAIALSSTTFIGNIMAGIMLKAVGHARPGDFITVQDLTGRITEMGLLHTEIQTEFRDLVTVPNLYMVTHPLQVVRGSGTIITAEVSLGYDVSHDHVAQVLRQATEQAGLGDGFVQVRELGDFAVTYRVAGLLEDVKSLISARSALRETMLDALHEAGIEIVSPNFMNTRALDPNQAVIPDSRRARSARRRRQAEDIAFDKAEDAASIERIRHDIEKVSAEIESLGSEPDPATVSALEARRSELIERLRSAEAELEAAARADEDRSTA